MKDTSPIRYAQETPYAAVTDISSDPLPGEPTHRPKAERQVGKLLQYHSLTSVQFTIETYCRRYILTQPWQHPLYASSKQLKHQLLPPGSLGRYIPYRMLDSVVSAIISVLPTTPIHSAYHSHERAHPRPLLRSPKRSWFDV